MSFRASLCRASVPSASVMPAQMFMNTWLLLIA